MKFIIPIFAGSALSFAFAPFNLWWLGLISLILLNYQWLNSDRPAFLGYLFGLGLFGAGVHWVYISLHDFGGAHLLFAIGANILLVAFLALFPCLVGYLLGQFTSKNSLMRALTVPLLWLISELIRAYILSGFPFLSIGYTQLDAILDGLAPLGGVWLVGWALMLISALLALSFRTRQVHAGIAGLLLGLICWACKHLHFTAPFGAPLSVALLQGNIDQVTKFDPNKMSQNLQIYLEMMKKRSESVVIMPETAMGFFEDNLRDNLLLLLDDELYARQQALLTGIPTGNLEAGVYYNSVIALGVGHGRYHKHHLLPFGEYVPFRAVFQRFHDYVNIPLSDFSRGKIKQNPLITHGIAVGVSICYEGAFGRDVRQALPEARYLVNVSNDGWFRGSIAYDQHLQMNQMRALETGREMARATNTGLTAFINAKGQIVQVLPRDVQGVLSGSIQPRIGATPYVLWGNQIIFIVLSAYLLILLGIFYRQKRLT